MNETTRVIDELVGDLKPTGPPPNVFRLGLYWSVSAIVLTAVLMMLIAPFRPGFVDQLMASPRFVFESVLGLLVCVGIAHAAFALGIPDSRSHWWRARLNIAILGLWIALFVVALFEPIFAPSMVGKRPLCNLEVLLYSIPLSLSGLVVLRRMLPLSPIADGAWVGVAAGLIPAYLMQFACMHEPWHIVYHHLAPIVGSALIGAPLGYLLLRSRPAG